MTKTRFPGESASRNLLLFLIINYISHCVYLLYKAIKQTVSVVYSVKRQK